MKPFRSFAAAGVALALAGCCSNITTDPREGGLAGGVCGTTTGAYDDRLAALRDRASSLDDANDRLSASLASTRRETTAADQVIRRKKAELASAQRDLEELRVIAERKQILRSEIAALMQKAADREGRIMAIENGIASARNAQASDDAKRQAQLVPVDDLLRSIRSVEAQLR